MLQVIVPVLVQDASSDGLPDFCQSHFHLVYTLRLAPHIQLVVHETDDQQFQCMTSQVILLISGTDRPAAALLQ